MECGRVPLVEEDAYLAAHEDDFRYRMQRVSDSIKKIEENEGGLEKFSRGYERFGFRRVDNGIKYSEWAPGASSMSLVGDFNQWDGGKNPCERDEFGVFHCFIPDVNGVEAIPHGSKVKARLVTAHGETVDRIPAWIRRVVQEEGKINYDAQYWNPPNPYVFCNEKPKVPKNLKVYECHVGMGTSDPKVGSYKEFTNKVLPRAKKLGYNCVQLMAVMEHAYYASFGYHVTNFFAVSSRCGTPEDLKELVDTAHGMGLIVIMDVIHSHASKNVLDGLNEFDGTDHQYFHEGSRGNHELWDSRLFNYGHWEVMRFLLSNLRWWVEEYGFDGFRFDGVTSMVYSHHGLGVGFTGNYNEYFGPGVNDDDAVTYLMVANKMLHDIYGDDHILTIAEDVSGRPGMCRRVQDGGVGFDYRLGMAIPDKWIKLLKEFADDEWNMGDIVHTLTNRRHREKTIGYSESHDQALVGDKTIAFRLMDKEMYDHMSVMGELHPVVDRGMALHKMIRLLTCALGGEGWLTFFGNEFGHPEWIDFPRAGNGDSYHHARRRWDLAEADHLRYKFLEKFEKGMLDLEEQYNWLGCGHEYVSLKHEEDKVIVCERNDLVMVFNFHPTKSFPDYRIGCHKLAKYSCVLSSDSEGYGGHSRVQEGGEYFSQDYKWHERPYSMLVYAPSRTCVVYAPAE